MAHALSMVDRERPHPDIGFVTDLIMSNRVNVGFALDALLKLVDAIKVLYKTPVGLVSNTVPLSTFGEGVRISSEEVLGLLHVKISTDSGRVTVALDRRGLPISVVDYEDPQGTVSELLTRLATDPGEVVREAIVNAYSILRAILEHDSPLVSQHRSAAVDAATAVEELGMNLLGEAPVADQDLVDLFKTFVAAADGLVAELNAVGDAAIDEIGPGSSYSLYTVVEPSVFTSLGVLVSVTNSVPVYSLPRFATIQVSARCAGAEVGDISARFDSTRGASVELKILCLACPDAALHAASAAAAVARSLRELARSLASRLPRPRVTIADLRAALASAGDDVLDRFAARLGELARASEENIEAYLATNAERLAEALGDVTTNIEAINCWGYGDDEACVATELSYRHRPSFGSWELESRAYTMIYAYITTAFDQRVPRLLMPARILARASTIGGAVSALTSVSVDRGDRPTDELLPPTLLALLALEARARETVLNPEASTGALAGARSALLAALAGGGGRQRPRVLE